jgi:hypothetical protein
VKLYHRTPVGAVILAEGFRDGGGYFGTRNYREGVWLSDCALDLNEGAQGDDLLTVEIPESEIADYEWCRTATATASG